MTLKQTSRVEVKMTEADWQSWVVDVARWHGWLVTHQRPAMRADGSWRTAITGDAGFCDLVLVHQARRLVLFRELKTDSGKLSDDQRRWLDHLQGAGADADVWRPRDHRLVEAILTGPRRAA